MLNNLAATPKINNTTNTEATAENDLKYQHYSCSKQSTKLVTTNGKTVVFTNYSLITKDEDVIDYLNDEIKKGLNIITKGQLLTHKEADPMEALKAKHVKEYLASIEAAKSAPVKDMGSTAGASKVGAASTRNVPSGPSSSSGVGA